MANAAPTTIRRRARSEILERDVELALARDWLENKNQRARERMLLAYRPLALTIAGVIARQSGMDIEDLAQEAFLALAECTNKFDPDRGTRFGTFARWHIKGALRRYVMDFIGCCRIGTNLSDKRVFSQFRKLRAEIEARTQRPLDDAGRDLIAKKLGVTREIIDRMEPRLTQSDVSMDEPVGDEDGGTTFGSMLVDPNPTPEQATIRRYDRTKIFGVVQALIAELPEREQKILRVRLLNEAQDEDADVAEELGVSRERVRQLERKAFKHLRRELVRMGYAVSDFIGA